MAEEKNEAPAPEPKKSNVLVIVLAAVIFSVAITLGVVKFACSEPTADTSAETDGAEGSDVKTAGNFASNTDIAIDCDKLLLNEKNKNNKC